MFTTQDAMELREVSRLRPDYMIYALRELIAFLKRRQSETRRWNFWQRLVLGAMIGACEALERSLSFEEFGD